MIQSKERNSPYKLFPPNFPPKNSGKGVFLNNKKPHIVVNLVKSTQYVVFLSALPKIADFISRFEFSFLRFLAFSVPFSNHTLRDFKEEISNNLLRFCILFRFRELHFLRDR